MKHVIENTFVENPEYWKSLFARWTSRYHFEDRPAYNTICKAILDRTIWFSKHHGQPTHNDMLVIFKFAIIDIQSS